MSNLGDYPSPVVMFASALGCALDCNLDTGLRKDGSGLAATDDTAAINAFLAQATALTPVVLVIDGGALTSGIVGPLAGHWGIVGWGRDTGFYQKSGSNCDVIRNIPNAATAMDYGPTPFTLTGANVTFANFRINGNGGTGYDQLPYGPGSVSGGHGNGNSTGTDRRGTSPATQVFCMLRIQGVQNLIFRDLWLDNSACFNVYVTQCKDVLFEHLVIDALPGQAVVETSTDGIHLSGNVQNWTAIACDIRVGDDGIAVNAPEGYAGPITNGTIIGCVFRDCMALARFYATNNLASTYVDGVAMSGCVGNAQVLGFLSGGAGFGSGNTAAVRNVRVTDSVFTAPLLCLWGENMGAVEFSNVTYRQGPSTGQPTVVTSGGFFNFAGNAVTAESLVARGCTIVRSTAAHDAGCFYDATTYFGIGGPGPFAWRTKKLTLTGCAVVDIDGLPYGAIPYLLKLNSSATVDRLLVSAVDSGDFAAIGDAGTLSRIAVTKGALL